MRLFRVFALSCLIVAPGGPALAADDPIARARALYNQGRFQAAVDAAEQARVVPSRADAADLVAARAYLERYRASAAADDLTNARERFRRLDPIRFGPRERLEYIVGLGETLFFDGAFGAAATVFESVLQGGVDLTGDDRERVLDWWATAIDREARSRPEIERHAAYQRIRSRMDEELAAHAASGAATYWLVAAARAQGDLQAAWDAAQAGWVRAPLAGERREQLRADLDRLVLLAIVPERSKVLAQPPENLRAQWEQFKERWKR